MREMTLAVVGLDFPNSDHSRSNRRYEALLCVSGELVRLEPEPKNPVDPHAVAVISRRGVQIGYLTAERAPWIGARLRAGEQVEAVFQAVGEQAAFVRVRFGGGSPTLPNARRCGERASAIDGFFPDPEGSDWGA